MMNRKRSRRLAAARLNSSPHLGGGAEAPQVARRKIRSVAGLANVAADIRKAGGKVVLAHGVFDLLHMGHVRHLEEARSLGTCLMVTVTADQFVNKGPGRPAFTEPLRAEMLAALACVDWVAINEAPTAENAVRLIKPDIYVKGVEYSDERADVTGKIVSEREAVEHNGGRVVFTHDITFSSSELINRYLNPFEPQVQAFLDSVRENGERDTILRLLDSVGDMRVLLVGDTIIDDYNYVVPMGKSPKENLVATLHQSREVFAGGVIATANHLANICRGVDVITFFGSEPEHAKLVRGSVHPNVRLHAIERASTPFTVKSRFIEPTYMRKMFEVYHMDDSPPGLELQNQLNATIRARAREFDLVVVNDFGHGMIMPSTVNALIESAPFLAVNVQTNGGNFGFHLVTRYPRADYVCIDQLEARLSVRDRFSSVDTVVEEMLASAIDCQKIIVTQGQRGCVGYSRGEPTSWIPAFANKVVDTVGAGDAFFAITSPLVAARGAIRHVAFLGNIAGAIKVGIVGHRQSVDKITLKKAVIAMLK
jgi:rfaE bifunctional protein nucleotidyltransferase chain/domain